MTGPEKMHIRPSSINTHKTHVGERQRKKIILCFDGTGNKFKGNEGDTNILKIFHMLDRSGPEQCKFSVYLNFISCLPLCVFLFLSALRIYICARVPPHLYKILISNAWQFITTNVSALHKVQFLCSQPRILGWLYTDRKEKPELEHISPTVHFLVCTFIPVLNHGVKRPWMLLSGV